MIIGNNREQVIQNIKQAVQRKDFTAKVEVGDPKMSLSERLQLVHDFWQHQSSWSTKINNEVGRLLLTLLCKKFTRSTKIVGFENLKGLSPTGAIVTVNHFNQIDALTIKRLTMKMHRQLMIVIEDTNLKLPGFIGYLMRHIGTMPLVNTPNYIGHEFMMYLHKALAKKQWILIYPEQEMWWNYRKPRPLQRGSYYFAAKQNVPIISTFVEIQDTTNFEKNNPAFYQTKYILHILPVIYPNPHLELRDNIEKMQKIDYQQKVAAYEKSYNETLNYSFQPKDIAGWHI